MFQVSGMSTDPTPVRNKRPRDRDRVGHAPRRVISKHSGTRLGQQVPSKSHYAPLEKDKQRKAREKAMAMLKEVTRRLKAKGSFKVSFSGFFSPAPFFGSVLWLWSENFCSVALFFMLLRIREPRLLNVAVAAAAGEVECPQRHTTATSAAPHGTQCAVHQGCHFLDDETSSSFASTASRGRRMRSWRTRGSS